MCLAFPLERRLQREEIGMQKSIRAAAAAVALSGAAAAGPVVAQPAPAPPAQSEQNLLGLAVFSSDGQKLGAVTQVGMSGAQQAVRAEIGGFLGLGPRSVIIPADMFVQKPDHIEVSMTAEEVRDSLTRQEQEGPQKQPQKQ
jgi:hypothetical protein